MAINFGRVQIHHEELPSIKSQHFLITWSCKVMKNILAAVSLPMTSKLGKVVTYYKKPQPNTSHKPLNT